MISNYPDNVYEADPRAPWNQPDYDEEHEWDRAHDPRAYLSAMAEGDVELDVWWLHDMGYSLADITDTDSTRLIKYARHAKRHDIKTYREILEDFPELED